MKQLLAIVALLPVLLVLSGDSAELTKQQQLQRKPRWSEDASSQLIFFAVLEGLYLDGVSSDTVELIIGPKDKPVYEAFREHFIYACPLCHPAFEAFTLYRQRQVIYGLKPPGIDTFGKGLDPKLITQLKSPVRNVRLAAIKTLVQKWTTQRIEKLRLVDEERATFTRMIAVGRKQGMGRLQAQLNDPNAKHDPTWKACAICDGSFDAFTFEPKTPR